MKKERDSMKDVFEIQKIKNYDLTPPGLIIPYTIEEALEYLKEDGDNKIQFTAQKNIGTLMRFNRERNLFEVCLLNSSQEHWNIERCSYLHMKVWKNIRIYNENEESKSNKVDILLEEYKRLSNAMISKIEELYEE